MTVIVENVVKNVDSEKERVFFNIFNWDMSREKEYLKNKQGYIDSTYLNQMEVEYKKFVFLMTIYTDTVIPISEKVDDMWHIHVLHTKRYADFCSNATERFIHHNPTVNLQENIELMSDYISNTLPLYEKHFGKPCKEFWINISSGGACCTH